MDINMPEFSFAVKRRGKTKNKKSENGLYLIFS